MYKRQVYTLNGLKKLGRGVRVAIIAFIVVVTAHVSPSARPRFGTARLELQAVARRGKSRTIGEVRRGFIEAAVLEQGYQTSEVASFLVSVSGCGVRVAIFAFTVVVTAHASPSACPRFGPARLESQAMARRGKSRTIRKVRRGFIAAAVVEQGYQASEVADFLGSHASNASRALQKRGNKMWARIVSLAPVPGPDDLILHMCFWKY